MTALGWTPEGRKGDEKRLGRKNCGKMGEQGRMDELKCGQSGGTEQGGLGRRLYALSGAERFKVKERSVLAKLVTIRINWRNSERAFIFLLLASKIKKPPYDRINCTKA